MTVKLGKWAVDHVRMGALEAKRDFNQIDTTLVTAGFISNDMRKTREEVQWCPMALANHVLDLLARYPPSSPPSDLLKDMEQFRGRYDYFKHGENIADHDIVTDEMIEKFTVIGEPKNCIERIALVEKAGLKDICIYLFSRENATSWNPSEKKFWHISMNRQKNRVSEQFPNDI